MKQRKAAEELEIGDYIVDGRGEPHLINDLVPLHDGRIFIEAGRLKLAPMGIQMVCVLSDEACAAIDAKILMDDGYQPVEKWRAIADGQVVAEVDHVGEFVDLGLDKAEDVKFERLYEYVERSWSRDIIKFDGGDSEGD